MKKFWEEMTRPALQEVTVAKRLLRPGDRVRLRPEKGGDIMDIALSGRVAVIEGIDQDEAGGYHIGVVVEDDPGRDLGVARNPAHRFFFAPSELEPLDPEPERRVLVAGIGNVFFGDDGFGVAVAQKLGGRTLPQAVEVRDFGIRGMDLAYALGEGYQTAILIDAVHRGGAPGTLFVIEPDHEDEVSYPHDSHQMNPLAVLQLARALGPLPSRILIVGCEPDSLSSPDLTPPVAAAVDRAADMVLELAARALRTSQSRSQS